LLHGGWEMKERKGPRFHYVLQKHVLSGVTSSTKIHCLNVPRPPIAVQATDDGALSRFKLYQAPTWQVSASGGQDASVPTGLLRCLHSVSTGFPQSE
jgi:hypothetical protein